MQDGAGIKRLPRSDLKTRQRGRLTPPNKLCSSETIRPSMIAQHIFIKNSIVIIELLLANWSCKVLEVIACQTCKSSSVSYIFSIHPFIFQESHDAAEPIEDCQEHISLGNLLLSFRNLELTNITSGPKGQQLLLWSNRFGHA